LICFIPIIYVTWKAWKERVIVPFVEDEPENIQGVPDTSSLSNFKKAAEAAIGYLSDGSEFVR
jgi:hypothetical protein